MRTSLLGLTSGLVLLAGFLGAAPQTDPPADETAAEEKPARVMVIPLSDDEDYMVDQVQAEFIIAALERAEKENFSRVILEIDTFGGYVFSAREMTEKLLRSKVPTTAFVKTKAISAGAFVAWACDEIVMRPLTTMGDAQVIMQTAQGIEAAPEKSVSVYRDDWEKASSTKNRPFAVARGFFDIDREILQVGTETDFEFTTRKDYDRLPEAERKPILNVLCEKGELLTMHAKEAEGYGLVTIHEDMEAYLATLGFTMDQVVEVDMETNQTILRYLGMNPWIFLVLTLIGLNGLYMELKAPGFGIPGLTAVVCFTVVFGARYFLGTADTFEMALFVIGLLLCLVEIFILPGFGVAGISGLVCVFGALVLASLPDFGGLPEYDWQWEMVSDAATPVLGSFVLSIVVFITIVPLVIKIPAAKRNLLPNEMTADKGFIIDTVPEHDNLIGRQGMARGDLRPTGKMALDDGRLLDVVSDGGFIADGAEVEIFSVDGNRIIVRQRAAGAV
ncbi:MAG: NfeD family protein [Acidobacteriota bacterium]|nr:NfeD family protein [Acidobacteriota bacterium]